MSTSAQSGHENRAVLEKRDGRVATLILNRPERMNALNADLIVALNDALNRLAAIDPRKSQVVELRFFGGLTAEEAAEVLKVSPHTVLRDWKLAKVWLHRELTGEMCDEA